MMLEHMLRISLCQLIGLSTVPFCMRISLHLSKLLISGCSNLEETVTGHPIGASGPKPVVSGLIRVRLEALGSIKNTITVPQSGFEAPTISFGKWSREKAVGALTFVRNTRPQGGCCASQNQEGYALRRSHVGLTPYSFSFALRRCSSQPHTRTERRYIQTG